LFEKLFNTTWCVNVIYAPTSITQDSFGAVIGEETKLQEAK